MQSSASIDDRVAKGYHVMRFAFKETLDGRPAFAPGLDDRSTLGESGPRNVVEWHLARLGGER